MPKFRKKPEIVDAYEIEGQDIWIIKNGDGPTLALRGDLFRQQYERVSNNYLVQPLAIDPGHRSE